MKQHIVIKLKEGIDPQKHWSNVIQNKGGVRSTIHHDIDRLLTEYDLPVWVTAEYPPKEVEFSTVEKETGLDRTYRLVLKRDQVIPKSLMNKLSGLAIVEDVRTGEVIKTDLPEISHATSLSGRGHADYLKVAKVHRDFNQGNPDVVVAVLDTGVNQDHPELKDNLLPGFDFVDILDGATQFFGDSKGMDKDPEDELVGHGTHVAGIIAAQGRQMPVGLVPNCKILPVRVLGSVKQGDKYVGAGFIDHINAGIKWAVDQGADIINMSLGVRHQGGGLPHKDAIAYAIKNGVTIVAASGNDGKQELYYPGALPDVIAVGAMLDENKVAPFSTYGKVTVCAPGEQIYSSSVNQSYAYASGTSQAAPFVSGLIALLKSEALKFDRKLSDKQIKYILKNTSDKPTNRIRDMRTGFGQINPYDALTFLNYKLN